MWAQQFNSRCLVVKSPESSDSGLLFGEEMSEIHADEVEIRGLWFADGGRMTSDDACKRVQRLTAEYLQEVARAKRGWEKLYRDPVDGRYWEISYPFGGGQAAGPATLRCVELAAVQERYGLA